MVPKLTELIEKQKFHEAAQLLLDYGEYQRLRFLLLEEVKKTLKAMFPAVVYPLEE
jgi:hypothetical protein